jgi:hypothetical protein
VRRHSEHPIAIGDANDDPDNVSGLNVAVDSLADSLFSCGKLGRRSIGCRRRGAGELRAEERDGARSHHCFAPP